MAEEAIFNYSKLTPFEKEIMRRLIPFYTFARKNFEAQLRTLISKPGIWGIQFKLFNGLNESFSEMHEADEQQIPQYLKNRLGFFAGKDYITGFSLPSEEFLSRMTGKNGIIWNAISNTIAQANPLVKMPIEMATGIDLYKGRPIAEIQNPDEFISMLASLPEPVGKAFEKLFEIRKVENYPVYANGFIVGTRTKYFANPYALWFMRNLPTARLQSTLSSFIPSDEPSEHITPYASQLGNIAGYRFDMEKRRFLNNLEKYNELGEWLERMQILDEYRVYYRQKPVEQRILEQYKNK